MYKLSTTILSIVSLSFQYVSINAIFVVSQKNSILAIGSKLNNNKREMITSGISTVGPTPEDINCYIGTLSEIGETIHIDTTQMCLHLELLESEASNNSSLPDGIVTAINEQQKPILLSLDYKNVLEATFSDTIELSSDRFPAIMTADGLGVYIALHDTGDTTYDRFSTYSSHNKTKTIWNYLKTLSHPENEQINQSPHIHKYSILKEDDREIPVWEQELTTLEGKTLITAMEAIPSRNKLVVAGSTTGYGEKIGAGAIGGRGNWDGYLTLVNMDTGFINVETFGTYDSHSVRIRSQLDKDDVVLGLCIDKDTGDDEDKVYVLGSTSGRIDGAEDGGAFVMKIDIDTLDVIWKKQFGGVGGHGKDQIEATHCDVQGDTLYVGGNVPVGVKLDDHTSESLSDTVDIFAISFNAKTGNINFIRQIDSHRDDQLVAIEIQPTSGELHLTANAWDFKNDATHVYLLSMSKQGKHYLQNLAPDEDPITGLIYKGQEDDNNENKQDQGPSLEKKSNRGAFITIPVVLVVLGFLGFVIYNRKTQRNKDSAELSTVNGEVEII